MISRYLVVYPKLVVRETTLLWLRWSHKIAEYETNARRETYNMIMVIYRLGVRMYVYE